MSDVMPDDVPILDARHMCIGPSRSGSCGCLLHYAWSVFDWGGVTTDALLRAHDDLETGVPEANERIWGERLPETGRSVRTTRALAARVWNRAMAYLGYVVGNPECTKRGTLRKVRKAKR